MQGKIDKHGFLYIQRGSEMKKQTCGYQPLHLKYCGDHCPLFGEPEEGVMESDTYLMVCKDINLTFESFKDERA